MTLKKQRWKQVETLYHAALERESGARDAFLAQACAGDEELRREVEELLRYDGAAGSFIQGNALAFEAPRLGPEELSQTAPQLLPGQSVGAYKITALLGRGGMGVVYRARDERLRRDVAIKLLPASFANDADRLRRFEQEAHATSALNHPNILTIYDIGAHEGAPFIVAELLEGEDLRDQLNEGTLSVRKAIEYAQQIAAGLAAAHEKGIVHRDLKPENLFVTKDGRVKILDFGLAKLRPPQPGAVETDAPTQNRLTDPGVVMGTVGYMSPEQARGQETDHRSDIFAFGVILYEMLSGERPFRGASAIEVMNAILKEEPTELGETNAKISPQLEKLVRRCLEKQPVRRFQSASDLGFALEAVSTPSGVRLETQAAALAAPERAGWSLLFGQARLAWAVAAVLLIGILGLAWAYFTRQPARDAHIMKFSILPPEKASFVNTAVSPDGTWLAFTAATGGKVQLWVRALASSDAKPLEGAEGATFPFWSPDSRFIGFFASGKLKKVEVSGGLPATLCDVEVGTGGTWNREGVILYSALGAGGIWRVPAIGGAPENIRWTDRKRQETGAHAPYFLPDGRHFLYVMVSGEKEIRGIYLSSLDGGVQQRLLPDPSNAVYATSSTGEGYLLFGREAALMAQGFDAKTLRLGGEPVTIAGQVGTVLGSSTSYRHQNVSVSDNGLLVFDPLPNRHRAQALWVDRGGKTINSLERLYNNGLVRLAPDDRRIAFTRISAQDNYNDIWLSDVAGSKAVRFTFDPANDQFPIWSHDGSRIVWASDRSGWFDLYEMNADGTGQDAPLLQSENFKFPTDWSRDGRYIIYRQIDPKTRYDLWVLPLFGERKPFPFLQTSNTEASGVVSPDGKWMAYISDVSGRYEVYVESFPGHGGKRQISTAGGAGPQWRGDGKELYYHALDGKLMAAKVTSGASLEVGATEELFEFRASGNLSNPYYSATRDGQRFLLSAIFETEPNAPMTAVVNWAARVMK
jgi:eukaryotic-like serine/threonine-protein kinase